MKSINICPSCDFTFYEQYRKGAICSYCKNGWSTEADDKIYRHIQEIEKELQALLKTEVDVKSGSTIETANGL